MEGDRRKVGYLLGAVLSFGAAVLIVWLVLALLQVQAVKCFMSLGCKQDEVSLAVPLLLLFGGYLFVAATLALTARRVFNSGLVPAFLWNVAPLLVVVALLFLSAWYSSYSRAANVISRNRNAIEDAPAIHLGETFVKKVDVPDGGVILFLHIPFTVERPVRAQSLNILATVEGDVTYSPNPECNYGYDVPPYGFHVVDREYEESPLPSYASGIKVVSERLEPGRQYYLLTEHHIGMSTCRVSDFKDFDPTQYKVTLSTAHAQEQLKAGPEQ